MYSLIVLQSLHLGEIHSRGFLVLDSLLFLDDLLKLELLVHDDVAPLVRGQYLDYIEQKLGVHAGDLKGEWHQGPPCNAEEISHLEQTCEVFIIQYDLHTPVVPTPSEQYLLIVLVSAQIGECSDKGWRVPCSCVALQELNMLQVLLRTECCGQERVELIDQVKHFLGCELIPGQDLSFSKWNPDKLLGSCTGDLVALPSRGQVAGVYMIKEYGFYDSRKRRAQEAFALTGL